MTTTKLEFPPLKLIVDSIHERVDNITVHFSVVNKEDIPLGPTTLFQLEITNDKLDQYPEFKVGEHYVFRRSIEVDDR